MDAPDVNVTDKERADAEDRARPRLQVIYEAIRQEGEASLERPPWALFSSAVAAGLSMVFSLIGQGMLRAGLPDTEWRPLVSSWGYTLGFLIVILGRQQLFTENTLTPLLPVFRRPTRFFIGRAARLWGIVLVGNLIGAAFSALLVAKGGAFAPHVTDAFTAIAGDAVGSPPVTMFVKAVFAGWLIALMVWLLPLAETAATFIILLLTYVVAAGEFSHVIAGSVEAFYGVFRGVVSVPQFFGFLIPTLVGNIIGGVVFVAVGASFEVAADD